MFPAKLVSYRLGYADGIGLPTELRAIGSGADCPAVACYATQDQILAQCPSGQLVGKRCLSAGAYCANPANAAQPACHALDAAIAHCVQSVPGCADAAGATTADAYACQHGFGDKPALCAALNRGLLDAPASSNAAPYSGTSPHNAYAAWLHGICPGLVAFPYDDAQTTEDTFHACQDSTQLNITLCPAG